MNFSKHNLLFFYSIYLCDRIFLHISSVRWKCVWTNSNLITIHSILITSTFSVINLNVEHIIITSLSETLKFRWNGERFLLSRRKGSKLSVNLYKSNIWVNLHNSLLSINKCNGVLPSASRNYSKTKTKH